jgi:hypothetical protein
VGRRSGTTWRWKKAIDTGKSKRNIARKLIIRVFGREIRRASRLEQEKSDSSQEESNSSEEEESNSYESLSYCPRRLALCIPLANILIISFLPIFLLFFPVSIAFPFPR